MSMFFNSRPYSTAIPSRWLANTSFLTFLLIMGLAAFSQAEEAPPAPCSAPECRQFDFWIGEWELSWDNGDNGQATGTNTISAILDSCVIQEQFDGGSFKGMSVSVYNPTKEQWEQTWVDNAGNYMAFTGGMDGERMILSQEAEIDGQRVQRRMVFYNIEQHQFDWDWEVSYDNGQTWELRWRIHYQRKM